MAFTKYYNKSLDTVPGEYGHVRVTISANAGQGNGGTSLPCKEVWMQSSHVDVRVLPGTAPTASTGIQVPQVDQANDVWNVLNLPIDDVSKLYFYGATNSATIDILYRL